MFCLSDVWSMCILQQLLTLLWKTAKMPIILHSSHKETEPISPPLESELVLWLFLAKETLTKMVQTEA